MKNWKNLLLLLGTVIGFFIIPGLPPYVAQKAGLITESEQGKWIEIGVIAYLFVVIPASVKISKSLKK